MIRARGAEVGFDFAMGKRDRIYNTFDAHRLLHWAGEGKQLALKGELFAAYFSRAKTPARMKCCCAAEAVGLDREAARRAAFGNMPTRCARPSSSSSAMASTRCRP
jgi:predicted DsbA family dithiol-disulfide isomerase